MDIVYDCYISAGIGDEESFSRDFLKKHNYIGKQHSYAFDASIEDYPWEYTKDIQFIKKYIRFFDFEPDLNTTPLPIEGLDYPNRHDWIDLPLFTYPFVNNL